MIKKLFDFKTFASIGCSTNGSLQEGQITLMPVNEGLGKIVICGEDIDILNCPENASKYLVLDVKADTDNIPTVFAEFEDFAARSEADRKPVKLKLSYQFIPNVRMCVPFPLSMLDSSGSFLPPFAGGYKGHVNGNPIKIEQIRQLSIGYEKDEKNKGFHIYGMWIADCEPENQIDGAPFLDEIGQYARKNWIDKTKGVEELTKYLTSEYESSQSGADYSHKFNSFGGWKLKTFEATGNFRVENDGTRWWLVDPEGNAFYSHGVCYGSRMGEFFNTDGIEKLCQWLPDKADKKFASAWMNLECMTEYVKRYGFDKAKGKKMFNFSRANMIRVFGEDWVNAWMLIANKRLKEWGINTIGVGVNTYEDEPTGTFIQKTGIPYVVTLKHFPATKAMIFRDFPDVFSDEYRNNAVIYSKQILKYADDPLMIGYFINNEPEWYFQQTVGLVQEMLLSEADFATKEVFIQYLSEKYRGEVKLFNLAWDMNISDFGEIRKAIPDIYEKDGSAMKDIKEFELRMIEEYIKVPSMALKEIDSVHLNLGMRYASPGNIDRIAIGSQFFDILSYNHYTDDPYETLQEIGRTTGKPVLIGEYHFGAPDRGLIYTALKAVKNQDERGKAYRYYVERAASSGYSVGVHWFEYNDQPVLGRFDGESYQIGFIDVCNKPYEQFVQRVKECSESLYEVADGKRAAFNEKTEIISNFEL